MKILPNNGLLHRLLRKFFLYLVGEVLEFRFDKMSVHERSFIAFGPYYDCFTLGLQQVGVVRLRNLIR